jgi:hypothetical protein
MSIGKKLLRVFIASPSDVGEERDLVSLIVEELRRNVAKLVSVELETVRWETHAWPAVGSDAQDVINRQIGEYDVFVGIMWKRFGTPTKRALAGTAEEFERAYEYFTEYAKPKIMFYFRVKPFFTANLSEWEQFQKVLAFRQQLQKVGVLFWEYVEPLEFERRFREHLTNQIVELADIREPETTGEPPTIYLSYKRQDLERVEPIYEALKATGFNPWIDVRDILPGKKWVDEIQAAIRSADFFVTFVSRNSIDEQVRSVTGFSVNSEINIALEKISEARAAESDDVRPDPRSYMIPVRLDPVQPPKSIAAFQWVDLFEPRGQQRLIDTIGAVWKERRTHELKRGERF